MATRHRTQHGVRKTPDLNARARAVKAFDLLTAGWTFAAIAEEVGYAGPSGAYAACQRELDRHADLSVAHRRQVHGRRQEEIMRETRAKWLAGGEMAYFALQGYQRALDAYAKLWGLNLGEAEKRSLVPYQKHILLIEESGQPLLEAGGSSTTRHDARLRAWGGG